MFDNNINNANKYAIMLAMSVLNNIEISKRIVDEKLLYFLQSHDNKIDISFDINNLDNNINDDIRNFLNYIYELNELSICELNSDMDIIHCALLYFNNISRCNITERLSLVDLQTITSQSDSDTYDNIITSYDQFVGIGLAKIRTLLKETKNTPLSIEYDVLIMADFILSAVLKDKVFLTDEDYIDSINSGLIIHQMEPLLRQFGELLKESENSLETDETNIE